VMEYCDAGSLSDAIHAKKFVNSDGTPDCVSGSMSACLPVRLTGLVTDNICCRRKSCSR
jgi:hypothetical protein